MKKTVDKLVDHLEWMRRELEKYRMKDIARRHEPVETYHGEKVEDIYQARSEYCTVLEDIATSNADKETLKMVAREILERWKQR